MYSHQDKFGELFTFLVVSYVNIKVEITSVLAYLVLLSFRKTTFLCPFAVRQGHVTSSRHWSICGSDMRHSQAEVFKSQCATSVLASSLSQSFWKPPVEMAMAQMEGARVPEALHREPPCSDFAWTRKRFCCIRPQDFRVCYLSLVDLVLTKSLMTKERSEAHIRNRLPQTALPAPVH